jgi:transposase-like protein
MPPHCPNPKCRFHSPLVRGWRFKKSGFFVRQQRPHRVQRFYCHACHRSFSAQTFSTSYWQKLPGLDRRIFLKTVGGMANRQIARDLGVCPKTIDDRLARLGRHCMLFHWSRMQHAVPVRSLVVDGFESFELSQYYPFHHHVAVEKGTDFFVYFTDSELRRKGRMTPEQRARRCQLERQFGRPDPQAVRKDMTELLAVSLCGQTRATVYSDDHRSYPAAIRRVGCAVTHEVTSSRARRNLSNPLWEVNLLDLLIRHCGANHRRETIAWSKRRQASAERLAIFLVWRNYMKGRREKVRGSPTPAVARGMTDSVYGVDDVLAGRLFPTHIELPPRWRRYYDRAVETRALRPLRRHERTYAR